MKRCVIGYIFSEPCLKEDEKAFICAAKKKNVELVFFNLAKDFDDKIIEEKIKKCHIIFNNSAEEEVLELEKTIEELGKKVVDSPTVSFYMEDKWTFFLECKKNNIPTINTILLSENIELAEKELKNFNQWPVILKRIEGTCGNYVEKAENISQAVKIIKKFWKKGSQRLPIIAQEFVFSPCLRITTIGDKIVQATLKGGTGWKKTAVYSKYDPKANVCPKLKKEVKKIINMSKIKVCGMDFLKKGDQWVVLEINTVPALDFEKKRRIILAEKILSLLKKEASFN